MSFFDKSHGFVISGGQFTSHSITNKHDSRKKGIDLLYERTAPGAFHNSAERYDPPKCHPNTRVAVIQAIVDWVEDDQKTTSVKWMHGAAGAGKSAIAQEIAEQYYKSGRLAASFFWSRNAAGRNDETRLIPSLAYQLLLAIPQIRNHVEEAVETDPSIFTRSMEVQMESLIIGPLEKVFGHGQGVPVNPELPKLIILDGLDECSTLQAQEHILKVIAHTVRKFPIPLFFLIASRPEQAIRSSFRNTSLVNITAKLALNETYRPDDDIRLFLIESFESIKCTHELRSFLPHAWPTENDIDCLIHKSSGQFIYASTVVKFVSTSRRRPDKQLDIILGITAAEKDAPFAELDALYHHIFNSVEDWPRVFDILACLFLLHHRINSASFIETILSYSPGELQLILIDLHSVMEVPGPENQLAEPRILHASLLDFLMDPSRSGNFWIDQRKAHAHIAQHFLRFIKHYSHTPNDDDFLVHVVFFKLEYHCSLSSPTRELLDDFFDFDLVKWTVRLINDFPDLGCYMEIYFQIIRLYDWLQGQEVDVLYDLGLEYNLSMHHSRCREVALDLLCKTFCDGLSTDKDIIATTMTHPQILYHYYIKRRSSPFRNILKCSILDDCFFHADNQGKEPIELQKYLHRAAKSFVHGGTYAKLSRKILDFILETCEQKKQQPGCAIEYFDSGLLSLAIKILPFYLSNAYYKPELARHASKLLNFRVRTRGGELPVVVKELHEAIDLYRKKRPPTPEAESRQQLQDYMNNEETLEMAGLPAIDLASPIMPPPPKRLKLRDLPNPAMDLDIP